MQANEVNEKPAIHFATTWDSMLHFVKLNSRLIQIVKQKPDILLAKISAHMVLHNHVQRLLQFASPLPSRSMF